jgi:hypothetical protein
MSVTQLKGLRALEGHHVSVSLIDGSRLDDCTLVSAGRGRAGTAWIFSNGMDLFLPLSALNDIWETS